MHECKIQLKKARKAAELQDHWTTRATLALPIDEEELFQTMGTRIVETSFDSYVSPPSAIMEPLETMDNWLLSFKDLEFNSGDENARKSGPVLSLSREAAHGMIPATRSYCKPQVSHELSYAPNHLTIMVSEEVNREGLPDDEEESSGDEVMDLDKEEDTEDSAQIDNTSKFGINVNGRSVSTQGDEKNSFDFPTPSMTEGSTTIKYSPDSKPSPSTPGSLISPKARSHHCPQCTYSCRRMCDLRKHSKYHTKDFQCSIPDCRRSFSRKQDLVRHEKGPHQNGRVEHYCPHAECQAKNQKPFSRKDNLMKHLRNKHSQNKIENDEHEEQGEHTEGEEREVERQNEEGKGEQDHSPGSDA
ncbi:hypothetical protein N431DRAFT_215038 [Stipitochalara longipes BDJ]|nr:hypothetical protein N431DRAFT_215038 [Stipitochalara longipes BDJ]